MTITHLLQAGVALVVVATPWFVVRTAQAVAAREGHATFDSPSSRRLARASVVAASIVALLALTLTPPSLWLAFAEGIAFVALAGLGWPALQQIDRDTQPAREIAASERIASLTPRRVVKYLPHAWRALPFAVAALGLAGFAYRLVQPAPSRALLVPVGFAFGSIVFLALYDAWLRREVIGAQIADAAGLEEHRRSRTRSIFTTQVVLVSGLMTLGHLLLDVNWDASPALAIALSLIGGVMGIVGCARALTSELASHRYEVKQRS